MRDVRMKGFARRADVEEVERFLLQHTHTLDQEEVDLQDAAGRVLAEDISSEVNVPGFARAAMDGYALRGEESFGTSEYDPISFELIGEALPGAPFRGRVERGQAIRIMTGAARPEGADAVVMAEVCSERDDKVEVREAVAPGKNVGELSFAQRYPLIRDALASQQEITERVSAGQPTAGKDDGMVNRQEILELARQMQHEIVQ